MSVVVRASWSPSWLVSLTIMPPDGTYGVLGHEHPELPDYRWVEWVDRNGQQTTWRNGEPAAGYYAKRDLVVIGTAIFG